MNGSHSGFKPGDDDSADLRSEVERLRAAITSKRFWVIATDCPRVAAAVHGVAALLYLGGAAEHQLILFASEFRVVDRAARVDLKIAAIDKDLLPPEAVAAVTALVRPDAAGEHLAALRAGTDLVVAALDRPLVTLCLARLADGRVSAERPTTN